MFSCCSVKSLYCPAEPVKLKDHMFKVKVRLYSVYDGDTIWVCYYDKNHRKVLRVSCRMNGYDAPEMKPPKSDANRAATIVRANMAKDIARQHFTCEEFTINVIGLDKYGRWLVEDEILKNKLLEADLAYEYHGGTKQVSH